MHDTADTVADRERLAAVSRHGHDVAGVVAAQLCRRAEELVRVLPVRGVEGDGADADEERVVAEAGYGGGLEGRGAGWVGDDGLHFSW